MAEGLKSYIARRREENKPLQFSNVGPGNRPESWDQDPGSTYFRPEQTWQKETEAELGNPASGFDYSEDVGQRFPTSLKAPPSRGSVLNQALGELQQHIPGIVKHTLGGKETPQTDEEKKAVQKNIQSYLQMIMKDVEKQEKARAGSVSPKQKEFEYYRGLGRDDKSAYEGLYGKKEDRKGTPAQMERYKYLTGKLKELDKQSTGELGEGLTDEQQAKFKADRKTILDGMTALEEEMYGGSGMQRAQGGQRSGKQPGDVVKQRLNVIKQVIDKGVPKEELLKFARQNPNASQDDLLAHFGVASEKKSDATSMIGRIPEDVKGMESMTNLSSQVPSGGAGGMESASNLDARSEKEFKDWYKNYADELGLNPDPDDPKHFYDYRAAFMQGAEPDEKGQWPTEFYRKGRSGMNTKTGQPEEVPDLKNTPVNKTQQNSSDQQKKSSGFADFMGFGAPDQGMQRKSVPMKTNPLAAPTKEQAEAARQDLAHLASQLGVGPEDWKAAGENYQALGKLAKEAGAWAWEAYTNAIGTLLKGQEEARKVLPAYGGKF